MNFLQRTPFFRLLLPLVTGIVVFRYFHLEPWLLVVLVFLSLACVLNAYFIRSVEKQYHFRWLFGVGIGLFLFVLGYWLSVQKQKEAVFTDLNRKGIFRIAMVSSPAEKAQSYQCKVKLLQFFDGQTWKPSHGKAIVYLQKDSLSEALLYGDILMVQAEFQSPTGPVNPGGFDYAAYLARQGIAANAYLASGAWQKAGSEASFSVRRLASAFRARLLSIYKSFGIAGDEYAVLAALTLGYTDALQPDLRASYSASGAMHILSVSGLHVGIVYVVIAFLLGFMDKSAKTKVLKTVLVVLFLWAYAFITGLSPSVERASLMFSLVAIGIALDRRSQIYNTVFMSAFLMLILNPDFLYDVGFQLSYAAVLSIVFFQRPFTQLLPVRHKALRWLRDLFAVSVAAQLGTLPFTLYYFHQFPNYFLLTNVVAIPLSTLVIYLAIVLLVVAFIPFVATAVAFLLKLSLWLLNFLIVGIEHLPYSISEFTFDFRQMTLLFGAIALISVYFYTKKFIPLFAGLCMLLVVSLLSLQTKYNTRHDVKMIVYSGQKSSHINFIDRGVNYAISGDSAELFRIAGGFWKMRNIGKPAFLKQNSWYADGFAFFAGKRILVLNENFVKRETLTSPIAVDYLIIGNKMKPKMSQLLENVHPAKVIVDNTITDWYTEHVRRTCAEHGIPFYAVAEKGAYVLNFTP